MTEMEPSVNYWYRERQLPITLFRRGARMAYNIGEKPGKGKYCCTSTNCSWSVNLNDTDDKLPPCGNCGTGQNTTYKKC